MPHAPLTPFDHTVLDLIEHSPTGSVPRTPTYDESIKRLLAAQQVYHSADHKDGYVTARSLATLPAFVARGLAELATNPDGISQLESAASVFDRYHASLPQAARVKAEAFRAILSGRTVHHRPKAVGAGVHDPLHALFLVPGAGPQPGFPGNYLRGTLDEVGAPDGTITWRIQVMDTDTDAAAWETPSLAEASARVEEIVACAPFHLGELEALGFALR